MASSNGNENGKKEINGEQHADWDMNLIKKGLEDNPRHISEILQWVTDEGQELYKKRVGTVDVFKREENALSIGALETSSTLADKLIVIDLGAGLSSKTTTLFRCLLKDHPHRKILYVPIDVNEMIFDWPDHLKNNHPDINGQIVDVKPILMDMLESVRSKDLLDMINTSAYKDWQAVFTLFGPTSTIIHNTYFVQMVGEVHNILAARGTGGFLFTYIPSHPGVKDRVIEEYASKLDVTAIFKCIIIGLNKVINSNVNPEDFTYKVEFVDSNTTPGIDGHWTGFASIATAKENVDIVSDNLDGRTITVKKGESIRLSDDVVKAHYYEDNYIKSLAEKSGLCVNGIWPEPSEFISSVYMSYSSSTV